MRITRHSVFDVSRETLAMKQSREVTVDFDHLIRETPHALLVRIDGTDIWLPKACTWLDNDEKTITIPESLAIQKDLI